MRSATPADPPPPPQEEWSNYLPKYSDSPAPAAPRLPASPPAVFHVQAGPVQAGPVCRQERPPPPPAHWQSRRDVPTTYADAAATAASAAATASFDAVATAPVGQSRLPAAAAADGIHESQRGFAAARWGSPEGAQGGAGDDGPPAAIAAAGVGCGCGCGGGGGGGGGCVWDGGSLDHDRDPAPRRDSGPPGGEEGWRWGGQDSDGPEDWLEATRRLGSVDSDSTCSTSADLRAADWLELLLT
jgi:hypothetical protein